MYSNIEKLNILELPAKTHKKLYCYENFKSNTFALQNNSYKQLWIMESKI